ncbi:MAG: glycosyl hydrolase, partial [Cyclobacteriaceae bacterium]
NWDAPILVSPHQPTRLYFASQRVWQSNDRGDSWTPISKDLTRNQERVTLPIMDKAWSWDAPWDMLAMSAYNTITSLAESPQQEGLIYAGTDDGIIQVTENGGDTWRKIEVGSLPGVPRTAFVDDIKADLFDANTVYVALDNHKYGDFNPYLLKSNDRGKTWRSVKGNLPGRTLVWRLVQDHVKPELLFLATEFGIYTTIDGGQKWIKLTGGLPTISFRDLAIQRRENDLVGASFGRSFYVFDDYSVLRNLSEEQLKKEATLFAARKAWWYIERPVLSFNKTSDQGASYYVAPNPPFGSTFTYYLVDEIKSKKATRQESEKSKIKANQNVPFPGWEAVETERREQDPKILLTIKDGSGQVIRRLEGPVKKGFHRVTWDLRYPATEAIALVDRPTNNDDPPQGLLAAPGTYTVAMAKQVNGVTTELAGPMKFEVERLRKGALDGASPEASAAFWREIGQLNRDLSGTSLALRNGLTKINAMRKALDRATTNPGEMDAQLHQLRERLLSLDQQLNGSRAKQEIGEKGKTTVSGHMSVAFTGTSYSTYGPTPTHKRSLEKGRTQFSAIKEKLQQILNQELPEMEKALIAAGAPWVEGQMIPIGQ